MNERQREIDVLTQIRIVTRNLRDTALASHDPDSDSVRIPGIREFAERMGLPSRNELDDWEILITAYNDIRFVLTTLQEVGDTWGSID